MPKKKTKKPQTIAPNRRLILLEIMLAILVFVAGFIYVNETSKHYPEEEKLNKEVSEKFLESKEEINFERITLPTAPATLPRLGKDGALLTAYFFANYADESEQKFYTEVLPKIKKYTDDGTLKIYWVARENSQSSLATKCTQKYSDEFLWKYLDEFYTRELPMDYYGLLSVTRDIALNEYYFARCVLHDYYYDDVESEKNFTHELEIEAPTFILDGIVFTKFDAEKIIQTIEQITAPEDITDLDDYLTENQNEVGQLLHEPAFGNPSAPIQVIEFCDFTSEACRDLQPAIAHLQENYADEIYLKFYNLPLSEKSKLIAESAECAHEQGVFWNYYNWLFVNQNEIDLENLAHEVLGIGIQPRALELCVQEKRYKSEVENDIEIAERLKIKTVPTLCIDTDCLKGTLTPEDIDNILKLKLAN